MLRIPSAAQPSWVYRFWRDVGYAVGALLSGVIADLLGMRAAIGFVAVLTFLSRVQVALRMRETPRRTGTGQLANESIGIMTGEQR